MFMEIGDYMIKLVVLDMDGTLLQSNYELSDNSKKAIALLKEKNMFLTPLESQDSKPTMPRL